MIEKCLVDSFICFWYSSNFEWRIWTLRIFTSVVHGRAKITELLILKFHFKSTKSSVMHFMYQVQKGNTDLFSKEQG